MRTEYIEGADIALPELTALYDSVGWAAYTRHPDKMARLLPGSLWHLSAWREGRLVGLLRAVGDGCSILYIQDILVRPDCQRQGIGRALLSRALERFRDIRQVVLLTDDQPETRAFYQALGLRPVADDGVVAFMALRPQA